MDISMGNSTHNRSYVYLPTLGAQYRFEVFTSSHSLLKLFCANTREPSRVFWGLPAADPEILYRSRRCRFAFYLDCELTFARVPEPSFDPRKDAPMTLEFVGLSKRPRHQYTIKEAKEGGAPYNIRMAPC